MPLFVPANTQCSSDSPFMNTWVLTKELYIVEVCKDCPLVNRDLDATLLDLAVVRAETLPVLSFEIYSAGFFITVSPESIDLASRADWPTVFHLANLHA